MQAQVGDWLIARSHTTGRADRRAEIRGIGPGGGPPYTVRWTDSDHDVIVVPGPDAEVVSSARLAEMDRAETERIVALQAALRSRR